MTRQLSECGGELRVRLHGLMDTVALSLSMGAYRLHMLRQAQHYGIIYCHHALRCDNYTDRGVRLVLKDFDICLRRGKHTVADFDFQGAVDIG